MSNTSLFAVTHVVKLMGGMFQCVVRWRTSFGFIYIKGVRWSPESGLIPPGYRTRNGGYFHYVKFPDEAKQIITARIVERIQRGIDGQDSVGV